MFVLSLTTLHAHIHYCHRTEKGYPLKIQVSEIAIEESPVDRELVTRLLPKMNYNVLVQALAEVATQYDGDDLPELPAELPSEELSDALVANLHKVLFDIHVVEGQLICPDTGRQFPIKEGIPNMILHEDEL
jgi:multifunctional methyltransferase subunit TRM112